MDATDNVCELLQSQSHLFGSKYYRYDKMPGLVTNKIQIKYRQLNCVESVEFSKYRKWIFIAIMGYFICLTKGHKHGIASEATHLNEQGENEDFHMFGLTLRVQRTATRHHHYHRFNKHHGANDKELFRPVTRCPPPMTRLTDDACTVDPCESDKECRGHGRSCCYNGCIYTCTDVVHPPSIIDWQTKNDKSKYAIDDVGENDNDEYEGNLEFDILPGEMLAEVHRGGPIGEICSTTIEEGDILLDCPHGYICHVENKGDPSTGVPDRGRCIAVTERLAENPIALSEEEDYSY